MSKQCKSCKAQKYCSYADESIGVVECFNKAEQEEMVRKVRADAITNVKELLGCFEHDCENCFYCEGTMCKLNLLI